MGGLRGEWLLVGGRGRGGELEVRDGRRIEGVRVACEHGLNM